jgi:hypothetical protein
MSFIVDLLYEKQGALEDEGSGKERKISLF